MPNSDSLRIYGLAPDSIVDGPGLRFAIFVQGCTHACPGCHNPESHPHCGGQVMSLGQIMDVIAKERIVRDVTLSGGDPFEQPEACAKLARRLKQAGYGVWAYTGYVYEDLRGWQDGEGPDVDQETPDGQMRKVRDGQTAEAIHELLDAVDVLVDGPFVESLRSLELGWRGSSNQRVIDLAKMRAAGGMDALVLWKKRYEPPAKPKSW